MIGQTLGHYHIVEKIGAGGMGEVYRARDERLERDVALKVLPAGMLSDEPARKRFRKEALALSRLNHPHIATVHDFDTQQGVDFLVMEHIPGETLSERLAAGPLREKEIVPLGAQIAEGLVAAHEQGVVHRDLKPGNLRITPDGRLKILDFGLAKLARPVSEPAATESFTEAQTAAGTLPYMAPEQVRSEPVDPRSDIYAAGAVLYEMATGQRPFPETHGPRLIDAILHAVPVPPSRFQPRLSAELERIILKCLDKEPERRYQSAKELRVDLERLSAPVPLVAAARPRGLPRRWPLGLAATLAVGLAVIVAFNVGGLRERLRGRGGPALLESLAVLPLVNLSGDPEQDYFADGMTEALITELAKIRALKVISRTSVMPYKDKKKPLPEIARELNVDAVIEGSVLRAGERVRITAQLIEAATDRHLWAENYERDLTDILALQSEVAQAIAQEIKVAVTPAEQARLASARPVDPQAYEAYLKGRYFWNKRTPEGLQKGVEYFQQAVQIDPSYAQAYAGLADSYALLGGYDVLPPKEAFPRAKAAAMKALEIDETLAEAHAALAHAKVYYEWDWMAVEREYQRAIELNPSYATAHHWYALYLAWMRRLDEARAEIQRAQELDPLSLIINTNVGWVFYFDRQYDQAMEQLSKTLELNPNLPTAHWKLGKVYEQKGMYEEAIAEFQKVAELLGGDPSAPSAPLAHAYAVAGKSSEALKTLDELKARKPSYIPSIDIALVYTGLGEHERAFAWLEKAYEDRDAALIWLNVDPGFDPLRSDPRFQDLLRRMNFPE